MSHRGHQNRLAKQKKKREDARSRGVAPGRNEQLRLLIERAAKAPFGPAYVSAEWHDASTERPALVSVVLTRVLPDASTVAVVALVDRTCLGVKSAHVQGPMKDKDLDYLVSKLKRGHAAGVERVDPRTARSIVHHAIGFAGSLGFSPHRDLPMALIGPDTDLEDTPLAKPARPVYVAEPEDDAKHVLATLEKAVGKGGFDVALRTEALDERGKELAASLGA